MTGGKTQPHGIDIVRSFFERLDVQLIFAKRGTQTDTDGRFPGGFMGSRNENARHSSRPVAN